MPATATRQEPLYFRFSLGGWVERFLWGMVTYAVYASLVRASDLFRHFRLAEVRERLGARLPQEGLVEPPCPRGFSEWAERVDPILGCKSDLALAIDAAGPTIYTLLLGAASALGLVRLRKARDAGVTLTLPWQDSGTEGVRRQAFDNTPGARARLWRLVRPAPPSERPMHPGIPSWIEAALAVLTGLSVFVLLHLVWRMLVQPGQVPEGRGPVCWPGAWSVPQWLHLFNPRTYACDESWKIELLAATHALNALIAATLNALALVLVHREIELDGFTW